MNMEKIKFALSWVLWPVLFLVCMLISAYGFQVGQPILYFNIAYVFLIVALWRLEIWMPHERAWLKPDGQNIASILHTLSSKGTVQALLLFSGVIGLAEFITPMSEPTDGIWPRYWPLWAQVCLAVIVAEFPLYWGHRLAHETSILWRFHAIHHSVTKLWFLNTGRFHFIDSLKSIVPGLAILLLLGAPMEVVKWLSVITAFIGMLTHCNVEMRFGPLNYIFNTPGLHRWHHSKELREGNRNYGENIMLWDILFGSFYNADYRPPQDIGMSDVMPLKFRHQIIWPFLSAKAKQKIMPEYQKKPFGREDNHPGNVYR
jgi:sterol desaturase/sphingolipid hydroxylase (fatty acid hydroxylase superfamily)